MIKKGLDKVFVFAFIWGIAGSLDAFNADRFERAINAIFEIEIPKGSLYDCRVDLVQAAKKGGNYVAWENDIKKLGAFKYDPKISYFDIVVPTKQHNFLLFLQLGQGPH